MHATIFSGTIIGVDGLIVEVEVDLARGLPSFAIVGLPNTAVRESRERVTSAVKNSGFEFPLERITVNLAPADVRKEGAAFDLAIALGTIAASRREESAADTGSAGGLPAARKRPVGATRATGSAKTLSRCLLLGELALSGALRPVRGVLPALLHASRTGFEAAIVPADNFDEASIVRNMEVFGLRCLRDAVDLLFGGLDVTDRPGVRHKPRGETVGDGPRLRADGEGTAAVNALDMVDVRGQETVKRALLIAAAGGHHVLLIGPPGAGKTMLARRLPTILPLLDEQASLETTMIYSSAGLLDGTGMIVRAPFRAPHHTASDAGLIGGGAIPRPGEVTLAHNGVLFMDELPEFRRNVLEALREPLEDGRIVVSRARHRVTFPARFQLLAAMNPCPCGHRGNPEQVCHCTPAGVERYRARVSGPLLDRIGIQLFVRPVDLRAFGGDTRRGPTSGEMRREVEKARRRGCERRVDDTAEPGGAGTVAGRGCINADVTERSRGRDIAVNGEARRALDDAHRRLRVSARGRGHVIGVARTIADLAGAEHIAATHVQEALQYRLRDADFA